MHQSCHQQRPFLRDACSTEKEGLLHKETLRANQGTASPGSCGPFSCLPLRGAAEPSKGEQRTPLPVPASSQRLSFSFRSFLGGRRVAVRAGAGDCYCHSWALEPLPAPIAASSRAALRCDPHASAQRADRSTQSSLFTSQCSWPRAFTSAPQMPVRTYSYVLRRKEERKRSHAL